MARRSVFRLLIKYLIKRRIAWVALGAVMLCTTMVLVVISVMGGWLDMFKQSFHGLTGDVIVKSVSMEGFPYYQEMIRRIESAKDVLAAVPTIETWGLFNVGNTPTSAVKVMGIPIERIGLVNRFPDSLYRQHELVEDQLKDPGLTPEQRAALSARLNAPPSFALIDKSSTPLVALPADVKIADAKTGEVAGLPKALAGRLWFDKSAGELVFRGVMQPEERDLLRGLSEGAGFQGSNRCAFPEVQQRFDRRLSRHGAALARRPLQVARHDPGHRGDRHQQGQ